MNRQVAMSERQRKQRATSTLTARAKAVRKNSGNSEDTFTPRVVDSALRSRMIAEAAYFRAEQRGFGNGDPVQDWLEAEVEIDRVLNGQSG